MGEKVDLSLIFIVARDRRSAGVYFREKFLVCGLIARISGLDEGIPKIEILNDACVPLTPNILEWIDIFREEKKDVE